MSGNLSASFFPTNSDHLLPGVTKADTVHSLNLSIAFKYLAQMLQCVPYILGPDIHGIVRPHGFLYNIQTRIRNHLHDGAVSAAA